MKVYVHKLFSFLIHLLAGVLSSFITVLLIYFNQKAGLHHAVVLLVILVLYLLRTMLWRKQITIPRSVILFSFFLIILSGWFGPQFIYWIRPFTFYISGIAIGTILIFVLASNAIHFSRSGRYYLYYPVFLLGYQIGNLIQPEILQYIIFSLAVLTVGYTLFFVSFSYISRILVAGTLILSTILFFRISVPIVFYEEQHNYEDKVILTAETQYHHLVITQWHKDYWFFIDGLKNISSIDEYLYYEPMAHSVFKIAEKIQDVLVIGGENGCLIREIDKWEQVGQIDVISYDTLLRNLGVGNPYFTTMNKGSYALKKVQIIHEELLGYLSDAVKKYDAIFIDLPDPRSIETNQYYTIEFYELIINRLNRNGIMITQAGSPYFATQAFYAIGGTIEAVGFDTLPIHNQVLTLGEWGWYICSMDWERDWMKERLLRPTEMPVETKWFNNDATKLITAFGKPYYDTLQVGINSLENPSVYQYYLKGNWNLN